jgi:aminoglycoside N3'-acetyltransferase
MVLLVSRVAVNSEQRRETLRTALERFEIRDRVVFVHSSWTALSSLLTNWKDAIDLLSESIGRNGTLVMPTYPMLGLSQTHLDQHPFFDCQRTPSHAGLLTEIFRRLPDVRRSVHPTHPVAARGPRAVELTEGHERSSTPFDGNSPFHRMYEAGAVVLCLGVYNMTFRHLADHLIRDALPYDIYADRVTRVRIIDCEGVEGHMETRGHNPLITCNHRIVLDRMRRGGGSRLLRPLRRILLRGAVTDRRQVNGLRVEWIPVRPYVALYHRCYRDGRLRFFPRTGPGGVAV